MSTDEHAILNSRVINELGEDIIISSLFTQVTLCIFLRHWGCAECCFLLHSLTPRLPELIELDVRIILVGLGSIEGIAEFRSKHKLKKSSVFIVTDPTLSIHKQTGLEYGHWKVRGFKGLYNRIKLNIQGFQSEAVDGDTLQQGGALLFNREHLWVDLIWGQSQYQDAVKGPLCGHCKEVGSDTGQTML